MLLGLERYNFYVDLDGVMADFDSFFYQQTGYMFGKLEDEKGADYAWGLLKDIPDFWLKLRPMRGSKELWRFLLPYRPIVLTSPGRHDTARAMRQKVEWVERYLGGSQYAPTVIFARGYEKCRYATNNAVLIDDYLPNIKLWKERGGIPIHYTTPDSCYKDLARIRESPLTGGLFDHV